LNPNYTKKLLWLNYTINWYTWYRYCFYAWI